MKKSILVSFLLCLAFMSCTVTLEVPKPWVIYSIEIDKDTPSISTYWYVDASGGWHNFQDLQGIYHIGDTIK